MASVEKVLIIDDDEVNNFICRKNIQELAFAQEASYVLRAEEALEDLKKTAEENPVAFPDVIFLDINMPYMNGWEFLSAYQELTQKINKEVKLFILSSSVYRKDIDRAGTHAEITEYIIKPLNKAKLQEIQQKYFPV